MNRYVPTKKASRELRDSLRNRFFVPGPMTAEELADFARYLEDQGVKIHWVRLDGFTADRDMCPYAWTWRVQRGELVERAA